MGEGREKKHCTAVVLAGGAGSRMKSGVAKQFLPLRGRPVLWYCLEAVQQSAVLDDCLLVGGEREETLAYMRREIVEKYGFSKVKAVIAGGAQRCWSVANAMAVLGAEGETPLSNRDGYVFIHDGARPFLTEEIIRRAYDAVREWGACVAAVPSKDTVKIADGQGFAARTPDRGLVWSIQTPQVFSASLIQEAYGRLRKEWKDRTGKEGSPPVTDDAGVAERYLGARIKLVEGSYRNIKLTTPEDMQTAEAFLEAASGGQI